MYFIEKIDGHHIVAVLKAINDFFYENAYFERLHRNKFYITIIAETNTSYFTLNQMLKTRLAAFETLLHIAYLYLITFFINITSTFRTIFGE